jgi:cell wall-associated NlpC family hydrolase
LRWTPPGARALIIAALVVTFVVSLAPVATAVEPSPSPSPVAATSASPSPSLVATPSPVAAASPAAAPAVAAPIAPKSRTTEAKRIIRIAKRQIGDPWRHAARGPRAFDCSGLVIYAFKRAGEGKAIGRGHLASARAMYHWFKARHKASRHHPKVGDLVIWGGGTHVGIYIGKGKAISTLTNGVHIHRVHAVTARFTAYLHTGMWKKAAG